jgi:hypothetical protein
MSEKIEKALSVLKAELARVDGDLTLFDRQIPLQELIDAGYSPDEASSALEEAEQSVGMWKDG